MTSLLVPGNYQGEKMIKWNKVFDKPGTYMINLPTVGVKTTGTMVVEMTDKNGLHFSDEFSLTFHLHYYKILKWLLVLPMMLCWLSFVHRNPCLCHLSRATQSCERDNKIRLIGCSHN